MTTALALCAGVLLAASPAAAWTCTAKNAGGTAFTGVGVLKVNAEARALAHCRANSVLPRSCVIVNCDQP
jgi:hypothetical protein